MDTANEKFSVINLDLVGRVLPLPSAGRLEVGDLLQFVGKVRQFGPAGLEVDIPPTTTATTAEAFVPTLRRRRR